MNKLYQNLLIKKHGGVFVDYRPWRMRKEGEMYDDDNICIQYEDRFHSYDKEGTCFIHPYVDRVLNRTEDEEFDIYDKKLEDDAELKYPDLFRKASKREVIKELKELESKKRGGTNYNELLSVRKYPESYPKILLKDIKLASLTNGKDIMPFGSFVYRVQQYPSDVDCFEYYEHRGSIDQLINDFERELKKVIRAIVKKREHYMIEYKIGLDNRYNIDIGHIANGRWLIDNEKVLIELNQLWKEGLLEDGDYEQMFTIVKSNMNNTTNYDIVFNILRKYYVLRWSDVEILQGYKQVIKKRIKLNDALRDKTFLKMDMIAKVNGEFTEISNFVYLTRILEDGSKYIINFGHVANLDFIRKRMEDGLPEQVEKLLYSQYYYSPFKAVKRLWSLARHYRDYSMIDKLKPIISGNISFLYQLKTRIGILKELVIRLKNYPKIGIDKELQQIKGQLTYIFSLTDHLNTFYDLIDNIDLDSREQSVYILDNIEHTMKEIINESAMKYLKQKKIIPLRDHKYIPVNRKYL